MLRYVLFLLVVISATKAVDWDVITPLDQYVHSDDGHYDWFDVASYRYNGVTLYIVNMTSQLYQTELFSTRPIWWHYMGIAIPDSISHLDVGILGIGGGNNEDYEPPGRNDALGLLVAQVANETGIVSAYITQVPNQPTYFHNDPTFRRRSEDAIIAWTWRTFLDSPEPSDPTIIERMPMTKAAKRGLDTLAAVAKIRAPETNINRFAVTGASKRGWTTWSIAAVDKRVAAIFPMVFSMINIDGGTLLQHQQNLDGGWSFAFSPYWRENLTQEYYNPKTSRVWDVEDMYRYKERLTLPILEIVSSGDEFFLLDDNHHWWNDIPDPKWLMMLPNAEHTMAPHYLQMYETAVSFLTNVFENRPFPSISWTMENTPTGGSIHLVTDPAPNAVRVYSATTLANDTRRDFRLASQEPGEDSVGIHPVFWRQNLTLVDMGDGAYHVSAEIEEGEWTGFFIEGEWEGPTGLRLVFTTQVNIIPNTFPRPPCTDAESCWGYLV
jgi:PhoPQ-activated pathogenicity-related protein